MRIGVRCIQPPKYEQEKKEGNFIDVAVPLNNDSETTYASNANKHVELAEERDQTWQLR
jgi:hypothetical protein